jgi:hypothetical protein
MAAYNYPRELDWTAVVLIAFAEADKETIAQLEIALCEISDYVISKTPNFRLNSANFA